MQVNKEKTQQQLDDEIQHDNPVGSESPDPSPAAPEETTDNAAQAEAPLIGDCDTMGTTLKPIC